MGSNDLNLKITKEVFGGNGGVQSAYYRELFEVLLLERKALNEGYIFNETQQAEIDKRIAEAETINAKICTFLDKIPLADQ